MLILEIPGGREFLSRILGIRVGVYRPQEPKKTGARWGLGPTPGIHLNPSAFPDNESGPSSPALRIAPRSTPAWPVGPASRSRVAVTGRCGGLRALQEPNHRRKSIPVIKKLNFHLYRIRRKLQADVVGAAQPRGERRTDSPAGTTRTRGDAGTGAALREDGPRGAGPPTRGYGRGRPVPYRAASGTRDPSGE